MTQRENIEFDSRGLTCRAWFYPPRRDTFVDKTGTPCVVMAHGLGGTREAGLAPYAERFAEAGLAVLVFDYRYFGDSEGEPRQRLSIRCQLQDWAAAIATARKRPEVDAERIALWGSSFSGGHVIAAAAADRRVAAVTAQGPMMDGLAAVRNVSRYAGASQILKLSLAGMRDALADLMGADPYYLPIVARPGGLAAMSSADAYDGFHAIAPAGWRNEVTARTALALGFYRPGRKAARLRCPVLVQICEKDSVAPPAAAEIAAERSGASVRYYQIGHFDIYRGAGFRQSSADQIAFLGKHLTRILHECAR